MIDVELAPGLGEHRVREIGDGDTQVAVAEIDADCDAGGIVERNEHRRAPGARLTVRGLTIALGDETGLDQVADDRRDRRSREVGDARQLCPARVPALAQGINYALAVALS